MCLNILKRLKRVCSNYIFENQHFKDIVLDLLNFKLRNKLQEDINDVYFIMLFQQKSFDNFDAFRIFNKFKKKKLIAKKNCLL